MNTTKKLILKELELGDSTREDFERVTKISARSINRNLAELKKLRKIYICDYFPPSPGSTEKPTAVYRRGQKPDVKYQRQSWSVICKRYRNKRASKNLISPVHG